MPSTRCGARWEWVERMDGLAARRRLPTAFIVLLSIGVGVAWLLGLLFIGALVFAGGSANPLSNVLPTSMAPELRWALGIQYGVTFLSILTVLGLGTAVLVLVIGGAMDRAAEVTQILVRVLIGLTIAGLLTTLGTPYAVSGSVITVLPTLMISLPMAATKIAALILADHYLRQPEPSVF